MPQLFNLIKPKDLPAPFNTLVADNMEQANRITFSGLWPLWECVAHGSDSKLWNNDKCHPSKVKLTLHLCPLNHTSPFSNFSTSKSRGVIDLSNKSNSDLDDLCSDSMSVDSDNKETWPSPLSEEALWSLPPYSRWSISIPCYTLCTEELLSTFFPETHTFCWSLSLTHSIGSPPPDSEDEDDNFYITITGACRHSTTPCSLADDSDLGWNADLDSEDSKEDLDFLKAELDAMNQEIEVFRKKETYFTPSLFLWKIDVIL